MEHIFEAFQNSFQTNEKVIFIANVKDENNTDGDLLLSNKRLIFYPAKPKKIQDVLFVDIHWITKIECKEKNIVISNNDKKNTYEMELLKEDFLQKIAEINKNIIFD